MRTYGTGSLVKKAGSRFWSGLAFQHGKQRCVSLKTESKVVAERALARIIGQVERGENPQQDAAKVHYEELRDSLVRDYQLAGHRSLWVTTDGQARVTATKHLDKFFAGYKATAITADAVVAFTLSRKAAGGAAATTNRALAALKRMFHLAVRSGRLQLQHIPFIQMLTEAPARRGFLEPEQFRRLRSELPERLRVLATVAYYTGMRSGELKGLLWESVDLETGVLRLYEDETKSGEPRVVPLNQETVSMLAMLPRDADAYVFGGTRAIGTFRKAWASACRRAGVPNTLFHDLRRSGSGIFGGQVWRGKLPCGFLVIKPNRFIGGIRLWTRGTCGTRFGSWTFSSRPSRNPARLYSQTTCNVCRRRW